MFARQRCFPLTPVALVLLAITAGTAWGQSASGTDSRAALEELVARLYVNGSLHGGILVAEGEDIVLEEGWGVADHELGRAITPETRFTVNSLGKMFTAILIMQLVEEGRLSLADPLSLHLPWFDHSRAGEITIHMLLAHRSGLVDYHMAQVRGELPAGVDAHTILRRVAGMRLEFEPGSRFHYSNTGYLLLGLILEDKRNQRFADLLSERIFQPLAMNQTFHSPASLTARLSDYFTEEGHIIDGDSLPEPTPGDGAFSSLRDMHRFMLALGSERLLKRESWSLMFTPHSLPSEVPEGAWPPPHQSPYGYGFSLMELPHTPGTTALAVGHGGAGLGSNHVARFLDSGRIVIVWNNIFKRPLLTEVFEHLARTSPLNDRR